MRNIYYFCNHPYPLVIMESIARICSNNYNGLKNNLIFVKHPYFNNLDYTDFFNVFDEVFHLPWIDYEKNVLKNVRKQRKYTNKLKSIPIEDNSLIITISYSDLATNIFCDYVKMGLSSNKIVHFSVYGNFLDVSNGKFNLFQTLFTNLNVFLYGGRYLKVYTNSKGVILDRIYINDPHEEIKLISYIASNTEGKSKYPIISFPVTNLETADGLKNEKIIILFGDSSLIKQYNFNSDLFYQKLNVLGSELIKKYHGQRIKLYYKPHPLDEIKIPVELRSGLFTLFTERLTAEMIFLKYRSEILAVYSISSLACLTASFMGIPSYVCYNLWGFEDKEIALFNEFFTHANRNAFVKMNTYEDIGIVDNFFFESQANEIEQAWKTWIGNTLDSFHFKK